MLPTLPIAYIKNLLCLSPHPLIFSTFFFPLYFLRFSNVIFLAWNYFHCPCPYLETQEACEFVSAAKHKHVKEVNEVALKTLEDTLAHVISQTTKVKEEYQAEQNFSKQVRS
jgi:hypothetical protein